MYSKAHTLILQLMRDIKEFRTCMDMPNKYSNTLADTTLHDALFVEEFTELAQADTVIEQADALIDITYVYIGRIVHRDSVPRYYEIRFLQHILDVCDNLHIPFEACWNEIHRSNMSKMVEGDGDLALTMLKYAVPFVQVDTFSGTYPCPAFAGNDTGGLPKGKLLKAASYSKPNLHKVMFGEDDAG